MSDQQDTKEIQENKVKIKTGNDPLGQAVKKEKQEKSQSKPERQQFVITNTLLGGDHKDLFSKVIPSGSRKVNFNTATYQKPAPPPRTIDFGGKKNENPSQAQQQRHNNMFGISNITTNQSEDSQKQQRSGQNSVDQEQQVNQDNEEDKFIVINQMTDGDQGNIEDSNNSNNSNKYSQIKEGSGHNLQSMRHYPSASNIKMNKEEASKSIEEDRAYLLHLGVAKDEYVEGESYITHSEVQIKIYDKQQDYFRFFDGKLVLSSYMLRFIPISEKKGELFRNVERAQFFNIALGHIFKVSRSSEKKGIIYSYLDISTKDFRELQFRFQQTQTIESQEYYSKIMRVSISRRQKPVVCLRIQQIQQHFKQKLIVLKNRELEEKYQGWKIFSWDKEVQRLDIEIAPVEVNLDSQQQEIPQDKQYEFRRVDNSLGQICGTYPPVLIVPYSMNDDLILKSAKFRSKERLPALSFAIKNPYKNVKSKYISLWRCAQCKTGLSNNRSFEDEKYFKIIGDCNEGVNPSNDTYYNCHIFDARPKINAVGMQIAGKGFENTDFYRNCQLNFLGIGNIHKVREVQKGLVKALTQDQQKYLSNLEKSGYFEMISTLIEGSIKIKEKMQNGFNVVVHCSDGWDRTSQLCCLVQILLDPHCRTIKGFQALIEKEWISFGHQFSIRCGHGNKNHQDEQRSPVFSQFLDCVHQLLNQYPLSFEFNSRFLVDINYHIYSCQFGTFLCNYYQEQKLYNIWENTVSLWSYMNQPEQLEKYINSFQINSEMIIQQEFTPDYSLLNMRLWREFYLYHYLGSKDKYKLYMDCQFNEDNLDVMHKFAKYRNKQLQQLLQTQEEDYKEKINEYNQKLKAREELIDQYEKAYGALPSNEEQVQPQEKVDEKQEEEEEEEKEEEKEKEQEKQIEQNDNQNDGQIVPDIQINQQEVEQQFQN